MIAVFSAFFLALFVANAALASEAKAEAKAKTCQIEKVTINGLKRTNVKVFEDKITALKSIKNATELDVSSFVKDLYKSVGLENITATLTPNCFLIVNVTERAIVEKILFDGNKKINSENLSSEMLTKEKQPLSMNDLFFDFQRLKTVYSKSGFLDSQIKIYKKNNEKDTTKTEIFVRVNEGKSGKIAKIIFNGNKVFGKNKLTEQLSIREKSIFKMFSSKTRFDEQTVLLSDEALRKFYAEFGYIDYNTLGIQSIFNEQDTSFNVYINLSEGDKYKISDAVITGGNKETAKIAEQKEIIKLIKKLKKLPFYQESEVANLKKAIEIKLSVLGYTIAIVEKSFERDESIKDVKSNKLREVKIIFTIKNADKIYINKIRITGNAKTNDNVIRREILLAEGDLYNSELIRTSTQYIRYLGYIKNVEVEEIPVDESKNLIDLEFKVEEGPTGSINFSAGYSSLDRAIAMIGYNQQNLLGRGYDGSINIEKSRFRQTFATSITNPRMFDTFLLGGVSFVSMQTDSFQLQDFKQQSNSGSLTMGYNLSQRLRHLWTYSYRDDRILIADASRISPTLSENFGSFQTSIISHSLVYDKRNNQMMPTKGFMFRFNQGYAGIGGNIAYMSQELMLSQHINLYKEMFVFSALFKAGQIRGTQGQSVNIKDRFLFGMTEMRGFEFNGIGPRGATIDANGKVTNYEQIGLRGNNYEYLSFEQTFPNFIPRDLGFRTYFFYDIGRVYGIDTVVKPSTGYAIIDSRSFRTSYGVGLAWQSPMGVIGFDYGLAKSYEAFDQKRSFRLNIGAQRYM